MNIDEPLLNLVNPPKVKFANYIGNFSQFLHDFSSFKNSVIAFDKCMLSFTLMKNIRSSHNIRTCIVYTHSHGSSGEESFELLQSCASVGISLCYYDSRGCGASDQAFNTFGKDENIDLLFICFYLAVIYNIEEFILWGRSIGSCAVLQLLDNLKGSKDNKCKNRNLTNRTARTANDSRTINRETSGSDPRGSNGIQEGSISFVGDNFARFLELNSFINEVPRLFKIVGMVLDSPPKSILSVVENFVKVKFLNFKLFTKMAAMYTENWIKKKIGVDITTRQNNQLVRTLNVNTIFLISPKDEMVPFEDCMELVKSFSTKCEQKCYFDVFRMNKGHKERRDSAVYTNTIEVLLGRRNIRALDDFNFDLLLVKDGADFRPYSNKGSFKEVDNTREKTKKLETLKPNETSKAIEKLDRQPGNGLSKHQLFAQFADSRNKILDNKPDFSGIQKFSDNLTSSEVYHPKRTSGNLQSLNKQIPFVSHPHKKTTTNQLANQTSNIFLDQHPIFENTEMKKRVNLSNIPPPPRNVPSYQKSTIQPSGKEASLNSIRKIQVEPSMLMNKFGSCHTSQQVLPSNFMNLGANINHLPKTTPAQPLKKSESIQIYNSELEFPIAEKDYFQKFRSANEFFAKSTNHQEDNPFKNPTFPQRNTSHQTIEQTMQTPRTHHSMLIHSQTSKNGFQPSFHVKDQEYPRSQKGFFYMSNKSNPPVEPLPQGCIVAPVFSSDKRPNVQPDSFFQAQELNLNGVSPLYIHNREPGQINGLGVSNLKEKILVSNFNNDKYQKLVQSSVHSRQFRNPTFTNEFRH
jgi:hypothetical protein